ncbi:MFS_1 domain-containing protein [Rhizoctonia solani AG-1 IA]|uniref:MFS_1 domain-containing protein n=1 Tax=Thanatephorus cucumeris (strain AG1-IA) TaxID=983506 RepID=L8WJI9_THACA|nr:MFS_1 domain-containing protein [Rhizoctonia solani AG-1 IA]
MNDSINQLDVFIMTHGCDALVPPPRSRHLEFVSMSRLPQEIELVTLGGAGLPSKSSLPSQANLAPSDRTENISSSSFNNVSPEEISLGAARSELLPVDVGFGAWSFVASAFLLDTIIWGFGFTYGVFQEYFIRDKSFGDASEAALGAVGTVALGLQYCSALFVILAAQQWRHRVRVLILKSVFTGLNRRLIIDTVDDVDLSRHMRCKSVGRQLYQQGGGGLYAPVIVYVSLFSRYFALALVLTVSSKHVKLPEWFSARKGLAAAIIFGGAGAGGTIYPLATNYLLENLGFRWTFRIWAAFTLVLCTISLLFMKPRLPTNRPSGVRRMGLFSMIKRQHWSFLYSPLFLCIVSMKLRHSAGYINSLRMPGKSITSFVQSLAYFPVSLYMSVYTTSLGLPPVNGTIVVAVFNLAAVIACTGQKFTFNQSGGFTSIWPAAVTDIVGPEHQATVPNVFGILGVWKGVAAIIGPVVAAALHHPHESAVRTAYSGYGFRDVTLFVGSMMLATAAGGVSSKFLSRR